MSYLHLFHYLFVIPEIAPKIKHTESVNWSYSFVVKGLFTMKYHWIQSIWIQNETTNKSICHHNLYLIYDTVFSVSFKTKFLTYTYHQNVKLKKYISVSYIYDIYISVSF